LHILTIQIATAASPLPTPAQLKQWASAALNTIAKHQADITLRIVDITESQQLNTSYRYKLGPTNVLSFPYGDATGDIVICAPLVKEEAAQQNKEETAHWAHLVIHGTLHLCGYDHIAPSEAQQMEKLEIATLAKLGFANPYQDSLS
jgi:probable rRNA maturation factor